MKTEQRPEGLEHREASPTWTARLKLEEAKGGVGKEALLSPEQTAWPTLKPAGTTLFLGITNSPHREWKQLLPPTTWPHLQALQISAKSSLTTGSAFPLLLPCPPLWQPPRCLPASASSMLFPTRKPLPSPDYLEPENHLTDRGELWGRS